MDLSFPGYPVIDALISPEGHLDILSRNEVSKLLDTSHSGLYNTFRNCSLAVLNCGNEPVDGKELLERYGSFEIGLIQRERGIKLDLKAASACAFVDGQLIKGIHDHPQVTGGSALTILVTSVGAIVRGVCLAPSAGYCHNHQ